MAAIHDQLYKKRDMAEIQAQQYFVEICEQLLSSFKRSDDIVIVYGVEDISLDLDHSVPVGLILNEIVVNSIKHGFPNGRQGEIRVDLKREGQDICFRVVDNGVGVQKEDVDDSMGIELIETLASQIDGTFEVVSGKNGTSCVVRFPY